MTDALYSETALAGRTAFVSGGASGIGRAIVCSLASAGAQVLFADIDMAHGEALAKETGAIFHHIDLTDIESVMTILQQGVAVDIVVNNAGVDQHAFFTDTDKADWDRLLRINLEAVFAITKAYLPRMQEKQYGRIVNIASEAGRFGSKGGAIYAAAKGGVLAFTKSIAQENARFSITSNAICPGPIRTPLTEAAITAHGGPQREAAMINATLLKRLGTPEEVANAVTFLSSEQAGFITGEVIGVSGGMGCAL